MTVDLLVPMKRMVTFRSYVNVDQRVVRVSKNHIIVKLTWKRTDITLW